MRPVDQTTYGTRGNCLSACVASILEMPVDAIPRFIGDGWWTRLLGWLAVRGLSATKIKGGLAPPGYSIAFGPSTRLAGYGHACVARDGVVVHDPHPSRDGLPAVEHYVMIHGPVVRFAFEKLAGKE